MTHDRCTCKIYLNGTVNSVEYSVDIRFLLNRISRITIVIMTQLINGGG